MRPSSLIGRAVAALFAVAACAAAAGGCAGTIYRPTEPRPVIGPGVQVDVASIRGAAHEAEVAIRTQQPTLIGPVTWSPGDRPSCSSPGALPAGHREEGVGELVPVPDAFEVNSADVVFVQLGTGTEMARPGLFLDVAVDTGSARGCLRTPLTAAGAETLWQAARRPWTLSAGLRWDTPVTSLEGTGARLSVEFRALFPVGPVRLLYGFILGGATCRGADCPPFESYGNDENGGISGLFGHAGFELGAERRFLIGRWSLSLTAGGSISVFHLGAPPEYGGERTAGVTGPFASLTLFGPRPERIPGFTPAAHPAAHGPELFVQRLTAFGRGPTESAWAIGFGWRIEGAQ